jgi:hypothetical protein
VANPWRFPNKRKLWKYCGLALRKQKSNRQLCRRMQRSREFCRPLRNVLGIAVQAVLKGPDNALTLYAQARAATGADQSTVRRDVARKLAVVGWTILKTQRPYTDQPGLLKAG